MPSYISESHSLKLVDIVDFQWGYASVIVINSLLNVPCVIMSFKTFNNALI